MWDEQSTTLERGVKGVFGSIVSEDEIQRNGAQTVKRLETLVGIRPTDIDLEIGCGIGRVGGALAPRCSKWIGTDISSNMIRLASHRLKNLRNIELVTLGLGGLKEIASESVDIVYCTVVFMHLFEWDRYRYVKEAYRVLVRGGRCYFDNVDITSDGGWKVFTDGCSLEPSKRPAHISMNSTGEELLTYATRAGFADAKVHRFDNTWVAVTGIKT